jgi:large subunit ribosomal protein L28
MNAAFLSLLIICLLAATSAFTTMAPARSFQSIRSSLVMRERKCDLAGTRRNKACNVSKSNAHTRRFQLVNLQVRKLWWEEGNKFVRIRISARTLKTVQKNGLNATAKKFGVNLDRFAMSGGTAPSKEVSDVLEV